MISYSQPNDPTEWQLNTTTGQLGPTLTMVVVYATDFLTLASETSCCLYLRAIYSIKLAWGLVDYQMPLTYQSTPFLDIQL